MSSPLNRKKDESINAFSRSYTTGGKVSSRQMFIFNEDGTIAGLQNVPTAAERQAAKQPPVSPLMAKKDGKFGKLSSQMSVSGMSVGGETKVAFSDADYLPKQGQEEGARIGKMRGKPGVTIWNLLLVPLTLFFTYLTGADVLQSQIQILKDDNYYDLTADKASTISSNTLSYGQFIGIPVVIFIGVIFDVVGRKKTIVTGFLVGAFTTLMIPIVSPSVIAYDFMRVIYLQTIIVMMTNPFINDYVTVQNRGVATGFQTIGLTAGNLISVGGLFTLTEKFSNKLISYSILAVLQLVWAVLLFFMITEPEIMDAKEERHQMKKSFCGRVYSMLKQAYKACKQDPALLISLIGLIPSRNTANLQQSGFYIWIQSFDELLTEAEMKSTWQTQNIISNACALPLVFLVGRISDRVSPKILVPAVLMFQILIMTAYLFCHDPTSWYAYTLSAFQGGSGFMIIVAMQGYAVKRVPKMIRGIIMALIIALSAFGGIIYLQLSKLFFDQRIGMVFGLIGIFDILVLVFIITMILLGKYGDVAPQEDIGEGGSQQNEKTADFVKDHEFDDDIPDVPFFRDIYDQQIPEMSSDHEASSFHTKRFTTKLGKSGKLVSEDYYNDDSEVLGSIRQTNKAGMERSSRFIDMKDSGIFAGRLSYAAPLGADKDDSLNQNIKLTIIGSEVNNSNSDEEDNLVMTLTDGQRVKTGRLPLSKNAKMLNSKKQPVGRATVTNAPKRGRMKRSSSFEDMTRQTLIQELIAGTKLIKEENEDEISS